MVHTALILQKHALAPSLLPSFVYDLVLEGLMALQRKYYVLRSVVDNLS
jgi:hypothetical protein